MGYYDRNSAFEENYSKYMEKQALILKDINGSIKQSSNQMKDTIECMQTGIQTAINEQTSTLIASNDYLAQTYKQGFNQLNNTIDMGFFGISNQLGYMTASFSFGLDRISDTLKGMSKDICDRLDKIHDIVNNPLLTQSRELFRRTIENYNKGFFEEALEDIQVAVEKYKTDYISWFLMGKIYSFGASEFSNVINLNEAINAYTQAAKYNSPNITISKDARLLSAEIYFYLGVAQYSQSNDLMHVKKETEASEMLTKAVKSFEQSFNYSDKMYESLFNSARCKVLLEQKKPALVDIEKLVLLDRNYCIKISNDNDFRNISKEFTELILEMKHNFFINEAEIKYKKLLNLISELDEFNINSEYSNKIPTQFTEKLPYFDILDYDMKFEEIIFEIEKIINKIKEEIKIKNEQNKRKENELEFQYNLLVKNLDSSKGIEYLYLANSFREMRGYKDSRELAEKCDNQYCMYKEQKEMYEQQQLEKQQYEQQQLEKEQYEQQQLKQQQLKEQSENWKKQGLCSYCGGQISGLFQKKCKSCGKIY